jgi:hypothetical protein
VVRAEQPEVCRQLRRLEAFAGERRGEFLVPAGSRLILRRKRGRLVPDGLDVGEGLEQRLELLVRGDRRQVGVKVDVVAIAVTAAWNSTGIACSGGSSSRLAASASRSRHEYSLPVS